MVVLFGAKRLPDAARSLGKSLRIFKSEVRELQNEHKSETTANVQAERVDPPAPTGDRHSPAIARGAVAPN
ncbi:Sec-independent protein translocase subunit TatA [Mycolicibacterium vaccae]|nr:Sec-independent protein translocase subunit TatA [Mycolicibacterium vaccae]